MTPLEDRLRRAFHERAEQAPLDVAPPLRLPARSRRSFPLVHGGGQRRGAPAGRRWLAPAASAVLVVAVIAGSVAISRAVPGHRQGRAAAASSGATATSRRNSAAVWVAAQVSRSDVVSCDPAMCQALKAKGFPARGLLVLEARTGLRASQVVVATAAVRRELGGQLSAYAPAVLASFGSGSTRVDVRVIAPGGAAAYQSALRQDLAERKMAGAALVGSAQVVTSATARRQMQTGQVDSQVLIVLTNMASMARVSIISFGDSGPGAGASSPLRSAELTVAAKMPDRASTALLRQMLGFLRAQASPYRPAQAGLITLAGGRPALRLEFAAPSPLGLLDSSGGSN